MKKLVENLENQNLTGAQLIATDDKMASAKE